MAAASFEGLTSDQVKQARASKHLSSCLGSCMVQGMTAWGFLVSGARRCRFRKRGGDADVREVSDAATVRLSRQMAGDN